jgi:para-aminobenzoate synthetase component 1
MAEPHSEPLAAFGEWVARGLLEVSHDLADLDTTGRWAVAISFEGEVTLARFAHWSDGHPDVPDELVGTWTPPSIDSWRSSMDEKTYVSSIGAIRERIALGDVYQANLCRTLRAPLDPASDIAALYTRLVRHNPAPHAGLLRLPEEGVHIASASPELFLSRSADVLTSSPIKGTGVTRADLLPKDQAENVMIVDLVRNDLGRVCEPGSVTVPVLLAVEEHPGLVHLVSTIRGRLRGQVTWPDILDATFPPGSVTGAPKLSALDIIESLEAGPRGPYCGAFGWVEADTGEAELAVAIRTFWIEGSPDGPQLAFGTGAGITWSSDPAAEWRETELKSARLLRVACDQEVP